MGLHETLSRERQWVNMSHWIEAVGLHETLDTERQWVYMSHWIERQWVLHEPLDRERQWVYMSHWTERQWVYMRKWVEHTCQPREVFEGQTVGRRAKRVGLWKGVRGSSP